LYNQKWSWNSCTREYLTGLRERHKIVRGSKAEYQKVEDVVIVRAKTRIGIPGNWERSSDLLPAETEWCEAYSYKRGGT
jgi:hypothetical protein